MGQFLADYALGRQEGRYVAGSLPSLPFTEATFDLAVCSHFLFLYSEHLSAAFRVEAIREMLRVAREARVFPLLELGAVRSRHLDAVMRRLGEEGCLAAVERVPYEFQRGGNEMLRVTYA